MIGKVLEPKTAEQVGVLIEEASVGTKLGIMLNSFALVITKVSAEEVNMDILGNTEANKYSQFVADNETHIIESYENVEPVGIVGEFEDSIESTGITVSESQTVNSISVIPTVTYDF